MQPTGVTILYALISGVALMAIPLITCILCLLILRRTDNLSTALEVIGRAVDGKLERLISARETIARGEGRDEERARVK